MPTYTQLEQESWWRAEFQPPSLATLCRDLRAFYGVSAAALGSKGDNNHLRGYHRSRNWIKNSRYATNRVYSVSRTAGDRAGGDGDWLAAVDATLPADDLIAACQRLDVAVRAGRLEKITEWYGNDDGDNRVDGYDNVANAVASSDPSHLWHLHMSFDRGRVGDDHTDLYQVLTGTEEDHDMTPQQAYVLHVVNWRMEAIKANREKIAIPAFTAANGRVFPAISETNALAVITRSIAAKVDIDPAELAEIKSAAAAGAALGVDAIVAGVLAGLPEGNTLTKGDVETALRSVLLTGVDG